MAILLCPSPFQPAACRRVLFSANADRDSMALHGSDTARDRGKVWNDQLADRAFSPKRLLAQNCEFSVRPRRMAAYCTEERNRHTAPAVQLLRRNGWRTG